MGFGGSEAGLLGAGVASSGTFNCFRRASSSGSVSSDEGVTAAEAEVLGFQEAVLPLAVAATVEAPGGFQEAATPIFLAVVATGGGGGAFGVPTAVNFLADAGGAGGIGAESEGESSCFNKLSSSGSIASSSVVDGAIDVFFRTPFSASARRPEYALVSPGPEGAGGGTGTAELEAPATEDAVFFGPAGGGGGGGADEFAAVVAGAAFLTPGPGGGGGAGVWPASLNAPALKEGLEPVAGGRIGLTLGSLRSAGGGGISEPDRGAGFEGKNFLGPPDVSGGGIGAGGVAEDPGG